MLSVAIIIIQLIMPLFYLIGEAKEQSTNFLPNLVDNFSFDFSVRLRSIILKCDYVFKCAGLLMAYKKIENFFNMLAC